MFSTYIYFRTKLFEAFEQRHVRKKFYSKTSFAELDHRLCAAYMSQSPYQTSKEYQIENGKDEIHVYGETPLTTVDAMVRSFGLTSEDRIIEMGAGRGRSSLFLAEYLGAQVRGYEQISRFVEIFRNMVPLKQIEMFQKDMFVADFSWASVIYLYGTMLKKEEIEVLADRFPKKTKILTVSYSLKEYSDEYTVIKTLKGRFPWGKTTIYCNQR